MECPYLDEYLAEDSYSTYHDMPQERDLQKIQIALPTLESFYEVPREEALKLVDGYGLDPKKQHFEHYRKLKFYELPEKLKVIESAVRESLKKKPNESVYQSEIFDHIESDPLYYEDEIKWIEKQQLRCENGTWIFIKGKPTFITGIHYEYLLHWDIGNRHREDMLPFYRDVDRRIFLFLQWAYTTKTAWFKYQAIYRDPKGEVQSKFFNSKTGASEWAAEQQVEYMLVDWDDNVEMENRTCYGVVFPKRRRIGGTSQCTFFGLKTTMYRKRGMFGIQALTADTARDDVYGKKIYPAFKKMWFFLRPEASRHDTNGIKFTPDKTTFGAKDIEPHGGSVTPRSSENKAFDGNELTYFHNDESGKKKNSNILEEFTDTIKDTLAYGESIHGFASYVSTLGKIEEGGREFFEMCRRSMAHERNDLGQTQSGLITMFIPAPDGFDGCIDIYGQSIIDDPAEPYVNLEGTLQTRGSKSILMARRKFLAKKGNIAGLNAELRNNPFTLREAAKRQSLGQVWDAKVSEQVNDLRFGIPKTRRVRLYWSDGLTIRDGRPYHQGLEVLFEDDPEGRFNISMSPADVIRNRVIWDPVVDTWSPAPETFGRFVLGIDPFAVNEADALSDAKNMSKGAGVMKWKRDGLVDPDDRHISEWESNRYILDYLERPATKEEFSEDMLMAAVLYGAQASVERNVPDVLDHWKKWKFSGYLMYFYNIQTGKINPVPGVYSSAATHQTAFSLIRTHLYHHARREQHLRILEQVEAVESISDVTHHDLFAATEMCELGCANNIPDELRSTHQHHINPKGLISFFN